MDFRVNSLYGSFNFPDQHTFSQVHANDWTQSNEHLWDDVQYFLADWKASPIYNLNQGLLLDNDVKMIYYLLWSSYANSTVATSDENRFKMRVFTLMFQYGPTLMKRLSIQQNIRALQLGDLQEGTKSVANHAVNPQTLPGTGDPGELPYINEQGVTKIVKNKVDAYASAWDMLSTDVCQDFINRFKHLFIFVVQPNGPLLYENEEEGE